MIVSWGIAPIYETNSLGILGQMSSPYVQAAEAIAAKYTALNAATPYPAILYTLSTRLIDQLWGTPQARRGRIDYYLRSMAIHSRRLRRSVLEQGRTMGPDGFTDGHYAGIVIRLLEREKPDMDVGVLLIIGDIALALIAWTRAGYPDMPRGLVCDVILATNGYYGIPEEEPDEGDRSEEEEKELSRAGDIAVKIGVSVITALLIYALTRGRRK